MSLAQVVEPDDEGVQLLVTWVCLSYHYLMVVCYVWLSHKTFLDLCVASFWASLADPR